MHLYRCCARWMPTHFFLSLQGIYLYMYVQVLAKYSVKCLLISLPTQPFSSLIYYMHNVMRVSFHISFSRQPEFLYRLLEASIFVPKSFKHSKSPFHNCSALLHTLTLLTAFMRWGKFIHRKAHKPISTVCICFCLYACNTGCVHEVLNSYERDFKFSLVSLVFTS